MYSGQSTVLRTRFIRNTGLWPAIYRYAEGLFRATAEGCETAARKRDLNGADRARDGIISMMCAAARNTVLDPVRRRFGSTPRRADPCDLR